MRIEESLRSLGLSAKESEVYLALLSLGQTTAYAVAEKSGLKRPTVYVVLDDLRKKGLVLKIPNAKKQVFTAKSPEEFFGEAEERLRIAKQSLPELLALTSGGKKPKTLYFEGLRGIEDIALYGVERMKDKEIVGFYAEATDASPELLKIFDDYNERLKRDHITVRGIVPDNPHLKRWRDTDKEYGRNMKIIPAETYSARNSIEIGDTFVRILAFRDLQGVIIENEAIAETMRQIFEMVWKSREESVLGNEAQKIQAA